MESDYEMKLLLCAVVVTRSGAWLKRIVNWSNTNDLQLISCLILLKLRNKSRIEDFEMKASFVCASGLDRSVYLKNDIIQSHREKIL